jgi:hypothetical protein
MARRVRTSPQGILTIAADAETKHVDLLLAAISQRGSP